MHMYRFWQNLRSAKKRSWHPSDILAPLAPGFSGALINQKWLRKKGELYEASYELVSIVRSSYELVEPPPHNLLVNYWGGVLLQEEVPTAPIAPQK
jgi:hypothetical protein